MGSAVTPQGDMPEIAFLIFTTEERSMSRFTNFLTSIVPQFRLCPTGIDVAFFGQKMKEAIMKTFTAVVLAALAIGFGGPGSVSAEEANWQRVGEALGKTGSELLGFPRTDLKVTLDGVQLKPSFALGSWLAFQEVGGNDVMVMGDLVLTEDEVSPVMKRLIEGGLEITALHNHLLRSSPSTLYMHVSGHGEPSKLATTLMGALGASRTPFGGETAGGTPTYGSSAPA